MAEENNILQSPNVPQPPAPADNSLREDWFKNELAGFNNNLADMYHSGVSADNQVMDSLDDYWKDETIKKPFVDSYGDKAKEVFTQVYNGSKSKLDAYKNHIFDVNASSFPVMPFRTRIGTKLQEMGLGKISEAPVESFINFPEYIDPWGRKVVDYNYATGAMSKSAPKFGWREGAKKVIDETTGQFLDLDKYLEKNPGTNFVYAANEDGSPKLGPDNLAYLRPLKYGEDKKTYEQYYTDSADIMGSKGIHRSDWYPLQWLPKNTMNFIADASDSGLELLKMVDNLWQVGDQSSWDKLLTETQNDVNSVMSVPTSEEGMEHWYTTEGFSDGMAQLGFQLFGMKGIGYGAKALSTIAKMGKGQKAGEVASRLWMATLVSDDVAKEGRENGLSPKEVLAAYTAYTAMMYSIAGLSEKIIDPMAAKSAQKEAIKSFTKELKIAKDVSGGKLSMPNIYQGAKNAVTKVDDFLTSALTSTSKPVRVVGAAATEALEEDAELVADKLFKETYNTLYASPFGGDEEFKRLNDPTKDARFNVSWDQIGSELAASTVLAAGGGGLFKAMDVFSDNSPAKRNTIISYGATPDGYNALRKKLDQMHRADQLLPGGKKVDIFGQKVTDGSKSRADVVYDAIKNEIDMAEGLWKAYNADKAFAVNEQILSNIESNFTKVVGEDADLRNSSLGSDMTRILSDITKLKGEVLNTNSSLSPDEITLNEQRIQMLESELKDITSGKNASKYLHESIYKLNPDTGYNSYLQVEPTHRLEFDEFFKVNNYFKERQKTIDSLRRDDTNQTLAELSSAGVKIAPDSPLYKKLDAEIDEKYSIEGQPIYSEERTADVNLLKSLTYNKSLNATDDFEYAVAEDGSTGASFENTISNLEQDEVDSREKGNIIFDDVERVSKLLGQIQKREYQLKAMAPKLGANASYNEVSKNEDSFEKQPVLGEQDFMNAYLKLMVYRSRAQSLFNIAKNNKLDFFKTASESGKTQMQFTAKQLAKITDKIRAIGYKDLSDSLQEDLAGLIAATDRTNFEIYHSKVASKIHVYFKTQSNDAIERFYREIEKTRNDKNFTYNDYTYLKAIISLDVNVFNSHYVDALNRMSEELVGEKESKDMRTPFPAQDRNVYRVASFLTSNVNPMLSDVTKKAIDNEGKDYKFLTESILLQGEQGTGKTLMGLLGVKIAQSIRGGKVAIFAKEEAIRYNDYIEATNKLKISVDKSVRGKHEANQIIEYLDNKDNLKDVRYLVIDEATLYTSEELQVIDTKVRAINESNYASADSVPIKILLMGDPSQTGATKTTSTGLLQDFNIGVPSNEVERTEMTDFSFRTGNMDILDALRQIRLLTKHSQSYLELIGGFTEITVKYDKKNRKGFYVSNNFTNDVKEMVAGMQVSNYFVITTSEQTKQNLRAAGIPVENILTPGQAQGQQRDYVFIDVPINTEDIGIKLDVQYKDALTAVGRAKEMVIINNNPALKIKSIEGQSEYKSAAFTEEQLSSIRNEKIDALKATGIGPAYTNPVEINDAPNVIPEIVTNIEIKEKPISSEDANAFLNIVKALRPASGEKALIGSFYTYGTTTKEDGSVSEMDVAEALRIKNNLTDAAQPLPYNADGVLFTLQYQRNEPPTRVVDAHSELINRNLQDKPKLVLYARLVKNDKQVATVSFGVLQGIQNIDLPIDEKGNRVLAVDYTPEQSAKILNELRTNRKEASINTIDAFDDKRDEKRSIEAKELNEKKIPLKEFIDKNKSHNYASSIWHVTIKNVQKAPWLFYSYHLTTEEIDKALTENQAVQATLAARAAETKDNLTLINQSRAELKKMGILSIPLDDGKRVNSLMEYLPLLNQDFSKKNAEEREYVLGKAGRVNIKNFVVKQLDIEARSEKTKTGKVESIIDEFAYASIKKKSYKDKYRNYLAEKVIDATRVIPDDSTKKGPDTGEANTKKSRKEKSVTVRAPKRRFQPQTFLNSLYEDLSNSSKRLQAESVIEELSKTIFKNGVYFSAATIKGSSEPGAVFGKSDLNIEDLNVAGYLSPANPIFEIPMGVLNFIDASKAREMSIQKTLEAISPKQTTSDVKVIEKDVPKDNDSSLPVFWDDEVAKKGDGKIKTLFDISEVWFKGQPNSDYFGEFGQYFRHVLYNEVFPLVGKDAKGIITSDHIHNTISNFRKRTIDSSKSILDNLNKALSERGSDKSITYNEFAKNFLKVSENIPINPVFGFDSNRAIYYDMVIAKEFDSLLFHYMPSIKFTDGEYRFVNISFKYNPIAESKDEVSHLATGSDIAKMHLFNTPFLRRVGDKVYSDRTLNVEDYAMIIRDMKDNDITTIPKATRYFSAGTDRMNNRLQQIKYSFYQRFLADNSIEVNGKEHHSIKSAVSNSSAIITDTIERERQLKFAKDSTTALLSFLASGNEAEYVRVIFNDDKTFETTGRITNITPSLFRADLEGAIIAVKEIEEINKEEKKNYIPLAQYNREERSATFNFKQYTTNRTIKVYSQGDRYFFVEKTKDKSTEVSPSLRAALLQKLGLGALTTKAVEKINDKMLGENLIEIAKIISGESTGFKSGELVDWIQFSDLLQELNSAESAYGYRLLNGEKVNLLSLSYPFVRFNQKLKEYKSYEGESPLKSLDVVRYSEQPENSSNMQVVGYALKEGFTDENGNFSKHNSLLTAEEQLRFDFNHLYLGMLVRNKNQGNVKNPVLMFSPITLSDKGSAVVTKTKADFLLNSQRVGGKLDMQKIQDRAINSINEYYKSLGLSIYSSWAKALRNFKIVLPTTPIANDPQSIVKGLNDINTIVSGLPSDIKQALLKTGLVENLHYTPVKDADGNPSIGPIKNSIIGKINRDTVEKSLKQDYLNFKTQAQPVAKINSDYLKQLNISEDEALESYFWNWNWASFNFTSMTVGVEEQYKSKDAYTDVVKRASQVSTNRMRNILRDEESPEIDKFELRKLPRFSNVAIVGDFERLVLPVSYTKGVAQKVFDGASFFSNFAKLQIKGSLGSSQGMNVGANLKPISTYMNPETGAARYDKYASYEITDQMIESGDDFIVAIDRLMKDSIKFSENGKSATINGVIVDSVYEFENEGKKIGMTTEEIYDAMAEQGVQDLYIRELTFNSSVKTGASNLNYFNSMDDLINADRIVHSQRDNSEWGLVLDASKESNDAKATFASQFISTLLQNADTNQEAALILKAINLIGERARRDVFSTNIIETIRKSINERSDIGMINQIVNQENPSMSNKMMLNMTYSSLAAELSDASIRFSVYGGQQVLAPATGVFRVDNETGYIQKKRLPRENSRELKGYDATRLGINNEVQSIKDTDVWKALVQAVDSGNKELANQLRQELYRELKEGGWQNQAVEVVISPIHFKAFGIPDGSSIEDITVDFFANQDKQRRISNITLRDIKDEATRKQFEEARDKKDSDKMSEIANKVVDPIIEANMAQYEKKYADFRKSLEILIGRIPATTMHSLTPVKVVGFAHGADNTFYSHYDLLVFHGADQDIDKGNILAFEPENGKINIPDYSDGQWSLDGKNVQEDELTDVQLKNFMVQQFLNAYAKPESAIVSTMPTSTDNLDAALQNIPEMNAFQSRHNPYSNNEIFERGQGGKSNTGIGANGLKVYSGMVFSSNKTGNRYSNYVPISDALSLGGGVASISNTLEGLTTYDEVIQAAVDNAKDPKLGRAGINQFNGGLVNALALHGYSPLQIINFLKNPNVSQVYKQLKSQREFGFQGNRLTIESIVEGSKLPELQDLKYFAKFADDMNLVGKIFAINQEIPNALYYAFSLKDSFDKLQSVSNYIPISLENFVNASKETRISIAENLKTALASEQSSGKISSGINIIQILNDNEHMLSYLKSFSQVDKFMRERSVMYNNIMTAADMINKENPKSLNSEDKFKKLVDFTYGLAIDNYLQSLGDSAIIKMNGITYDLRIPFGDATGEVKGRVNFMKKFPDYFTKLESKKDIGNNLQEVLRQHKYGEDTVLKPFLTLKSYSIEQKIKIKNQIRNVNSDFNIPKGDSSLNGLLQFYSLIKDKSGVSGTSFTEAFDYNGSIFQIFDNYTDNTPLTLYSEFFDAKNSKDLEFTFRIASLGRKLTKEEIENNPTIAGFANSFRKNKLFIPYTNSITDNDKIVDEDVKKEEDVRLLSNPFSVPTSTRKIKSQKVYQNDLQKRMVGYNVSAKMIGNFAAKLAKSLGVSIEVTNTKQILAEGNYPAEYANRKGFVANGVVVINTDFATIDTPIHEFTHLWMEGLKTQNRPKYDEIIESCLKHPLANTIREKYPEEDEEGIAGEVFATLSGIYNSKKAFSKMNTDFFARVKSLFDDFVNWVSKTFSNIFGVGITVKDSLAGIIDQVGESMISAMDLSASDASDLKLLGIRLVSANPELSALRERMKVQNRYEKIC